MCIHLRNRVSFYYTFSIDLPYFLLILTYQSLPLFFANISSLSFFDVNALDLTCSTYSHNAQDVEHIDDAINTFLP